MTHFLTGACLGRAGFNRKTGLATAAMCLAAEAPDIDIVAYVKGSAFGFTHHRGFTHTLWGAPLIAVVVVAFLWLFTKVWYRWRPRKANAIPIRWGLLLLFACISSWSHILLDFTNNYGVRPFWPFVNRWYSWDIVFIIEPLILAALIAGLVLPALFGLINTEIGARQHGPRGRGGAIFALVVILLVWGVRDYQHRKAVNALEALTYQGEIPVRVGAYPTHTNPFRWTGLVETSGSYQAMLVNSLTPEVDPNGRVLTYFKPTPSPVTDAAQASYLGRAYMDWSQRPLLEIQQADRPGGGYRVIFKDLRFVSPERRGSALGAFVDLDASLRVEDQGFLKNVVPDRFETRQNGQSGESGQ